MRSVLGMAIVLLLSTNTSVEGVVLPTEHLLILNFQRFCLKHDDPLTDRDISEIEDLFRDWERVTPKEDVLGIQFSSAYRFIDRGSLIHVAISSLECAVLGLPQAFIPQSSFNVEKLYQLLEIRFKLQQVFRGPRRGLVVTAYDFPTTESRFERYILVVIHREDSEAREFAGLIIVPRHTLERYDF